MVNLQTKLKPKSHNTIVPV